jgi:hypothetical protein
MNDAFDLMLGVYRAPRRASLLHGRAPPQRIIEVVRVAAGDAEAIADARDSTGLDDTELAEAAVLLLHHLLFYDGADHYRVLGVTAEADDEQIKRHYRALMRWLHPDRDPDNLHSVFAERVNRAWNALRTPQRRANYDDDRLAGDDERFARRDPAIDEAATSAAAAATLSIPRWAPEGRPWLSGRMVRQLPQIVAAGGAFVAVLLLTLVFWLQRPQAQRPATAIVPLTLPGPASPPALPPEHGAEVHHDAKIGTVRPAPTTLFASAASVLSEAVAAPVAADRGTPAPEPVPVVVAARAEPRRIDASPSTDSARAETPPRAETPRVVAPKPATAVASASASALSEDEIVAFVAHFEHLYAGDDVDAFLALFGDDAVGNGSDGLRELSVDYRRLFSTYARRELRLRDMRWQIDAGRAVGHGRYDAHVDASTAGPKESQGQILLALRRDGNRLRITRINHSVGR